MTRRVLGAANFQIMRLSSGGSLGNKVNSSCDSVSGLGSELLASGERDMFVSSIGVLLLSFSDMCEAV